MGNREVEIKMANLKNVPMYEIRNLCVAYDWFCGGTNEQYKRMFELAADGASVCDVALVIWLCSDSKVQREEIIFELNKLAERYEQASI